MRTRTLSALAGVFALGGTLAFGARSDATAALKIGYRATLNAASEVPANDSKATGRAHFTITGNRLVYEITAKGLSSGVTGAHIHGPAAAGANAGVLVPLTVRAGRTHGTIATGRVDLKTLKSGLSVDSLTKLFNAGQAYVNVHTRKYPDGEIRGWLQRR